MTLHSMTGFARADGTHAGVTWHFEIRSVNGRGLDLRLRLPPGLDQLEPRVREAAGRVLSRGSVNITLNMMRHEQAVEIRLNERALAQVVKAAERLRDVLGSEPVRAEALLGVRGVLEIVEPVEDETVAAERTEAMLVTLGQALEGLVAARAEEGRRLAAILRQQLEEISDLTATIAASPARQPEAVSQRLRELVQRIGEAGAGLDAQRLHQEAVLIATRADIEEELKRLQSHVEAVRALLASGGPVGRKLDFLAQEFFREANTLCSKSSDGEITRNGLDLKRVIDQMREQVQNIE